MGKRRWRFTWPIGILIGRGGEGSSKRGAVPGCTLYVTYLYSNELN